MEDNWIHIDKELPKEGQIILALCTIEVKYCIFERGKFYRHIDSGLSEYPDRNIAFSYNSITHWQPIPQPPIL